MTWKCGWGLRISNKRECVGATQEPMELRVERVWSIPSAALSVLSPYAHILHDFVILCHKDVKEVGHSGVGFFSTNDHTEARTVDLGNVRLSWLAVSHAYYKPFQSQTSLEELKLFKQNIGLCATITSSLMARRCGRANSIF
ncbi:hypothetical protein EI94DRAFT_894121 [Lactarius quietus]|nr:hypothetical protein EI94DRAFT_894121 [Lactarius quietus]